MSQVTLKDIYDITNELKAEVTKVLDDHEKRIRNNENFQTKVLTIGGVFSVFISAIASYIWSRVIGEK